MFSPRVLNTLKSNYLKKIPLLYVTVIIDFFNLVCPSVPIFIVVVCRHDNFRKNPQIEMRFQNPKSKDKFTNQPPAKLEQFNARIE